MITEIKLVILVGLIFHILDMLFTVLLIYKVKKRYINGEEVEQNYHKFFFKKFGLFKGALLSLPISLTLITMFLIITSYINVKFLYFLVGMISMTSFINFMSWKEYDKTIKMLVKVDEK